MTNTKSQAQRIADLFDNDGQNFMGADGSDLTELVIDKSCGNIHRPWTEAIRYEFTDGSSIVIAGAAWDLGLDNRECTCWAGVGHSDECDERSRESESYSISYIEDSTTTEETHDAIVAGLLPQEGSFDEAVESCETYEVCAVLRDAPGFIVGRVKSDGSYTMGTA